MTPRTSLKSDADIYLIMDILARALRNAENAERAAAEITRELRDLTGARTVFLVQCLHEYGSDEHNVIAVSPGGEGAATATAEVVRLAELTHDLLELTRWKLNGADGPEQRILASLGVQDSIAAPLMIGSSRVGCLLFFDMPDDAHHLPLVLNTLEMLSTTIALVFRNALLYQRQEATIAQRTRELIASNKALGESEEKFRQIAETVHEVFWMSSPDGGQLHYVSPAYEKIWGHSCQSLYDEPRSWLDGIHADDRAGIRETILARLAQPTRETLLPDFRVIRPDGSLRWISSRIYPVRDESGEVVRVAGVLEDITQRRQAEQELEKHRLHLEDMVRERTIQLAQLNTEKQLILDSVRATIVCKDTENHLLWVNKGVAELAGRSIEELEGMPTEEVFPLEAAKFYQDDLEVIRTGQAKLGVLESIHSASGQIRWILTDKIPIVDEAGAVTGIIIFSIDITERKQAQEKAQQRANELRTIVNSMAGRENRMAELKQTIRALRGQLQQAGMTPVADDPLKER